MLESPTVDARGKVIWLADDDAAIRYGLSEALRDSSAMVRDCAAADTLLAAFDDDAPLDVILSDVRMPGASGLNLLERLHRRGAATPVIIMSAFTDVASTAAAYRGGAFDYLPKPFDLDQAVASVLRALAQSPPPPVSAPPPALDVE